MAEPQDRATRFLELAPFDTFPVIPSGAIAINSRRYISSSFMARFHAVRPVVRNFLRLSPPIYKLEKNLNEHQLSRRRHARH